MSSKGICLSSLPADILLYIVRFSGLLDNVSFSMVCKKAYSLSTHRHFWIYALKNERLVRPIACASHEDLTKYDIQNLRRIALHTLRLKRNWDTQKPQILGPVRTLPLELPAIDDLFQVPGTELYVFYCPTSGTIELWHIGWGRRVGAPIDVSTNIFDISSGEDLPGKFSMALLACDNFDNFDSSYQVIIISVEYGNTDIALKLTFKHEFRPGLGTEHWAIFLDKDVVGTLSYDLEGQKLCIVALNQLTTKEIIITTDLPGSAAGPIREQIDQAAATIVGGDLCILVVDTPDSWAFTIPHSRLPHTDNPQCPVTSTLTFGNNFAHFNSHSRSYCDANLESLNTVTANATYGVAAISVDTGLSNSGSKLPSSFMDVSFWVQSQENKSLITPFALPVSIPGSLYLGPDGEATFWQPVIQTASGRKGLILSTMRDGDSEKQVLNLVSYEADMEGKVFHRELAIPASIDLSQMCHLLLDDNLGVVTVIERGGVLHTIAYA